MHIVKLSCILHAHMATSYGKGGVYAVHIAATDSRPTMETPTGRTLTRGSRGEAPSRGTAIAQAIMQGERR